MSYLDRNQFGSYMVSVGEVYSKEISPTLIEIYWRIMKQFTMSTIKYAFNKHVVEPDEGRFFPKPADLVKIINASGEKKVKVKGMCDMCNEKAMLIENAKSPLNGKSLCFDHYTYLKYPKNESLPSSTRRLGDTGGVDTRTKNQKLYEKMRAEMRQEGYEILKANYYASN